MTVGQNSTKESIAPWIELENDGAHLSASELVGGAVRFLRKDYDLAESSRVSISALTDGIADDLRSRYKALPEGLVSPVRVQEVLRAAGFVTSAFRLETDDTVTWSPRAYADFEAQALREGES